MGLPTSNFRDAIGLNCVVSRVMLVDGSLVGGGGGEGLTQGETSAPTRDTSLSQIT